jgi:hypothetical protein
VLSLSVSIDHREHSRKPVSFLTFIHHRTFTRPITCKVSDIKLDTQQPFKGIILAVRNSSKKPTPRHRHRHNQQQTWPPTNTSTAPAPASATNTQSQSLTALSRTLQQQQQHRTSQPSSSTTAAQTVSPAQSSFEKAPLKPTPNNPLKSSIQAAPKLLPSQPGSASPSPGTTATRAPSTRTNRTPPSAAPSTPRSHPQHQLPRDWKTAAPAAQRTSANNSAATAART